MNGIDLFKNKPVRFVAFIGPLLKKIITLEGDIIYNAGEYANEMYLIRSGEVHLTIKEHNYFPFMTISGGSYFGEVDLLFGEQRKYTTVANSECELLVLNKKNFMKIFFNEFREIGAEVHMNALQRKHYHAEAYRKAKIYCENLEKEDERQQLNYLEKFKNQLVQLGRQDKSIIGVALQQAIRKFNQPTRRPSKMLSANLKSSEDNITQLKEEGDRLIDDIKNDMQRIQDILQEQGVKTEKTILIAPREQKKKYSEIIRNHRENEVQSGQQQQSQFQMGQQQIYQQAPVPLQLQVAGPEAESGEDQQKQQMQYLRDSGVQRLQKSINRQMDSPNMSEVKRRNNKKAKTTMIKKIGDDENGGDAKDSDQDKEQTTKDQKIKNLLFFKKIAKQAYL